VGSYSGRASDAWRVEGLNGWEEGGGDVGNGEGGAKTLEGGTVVVTVSSFLC
jgi:hypothetical protein